MCQTFKAIIKYQTVFVIPSYPFFKPEHSSRIHNIYVPNFFTILREGKYFLFLGIAKKSNCQFLLFWTQKSYARKYIVIIQAVDKTNSTQILCVMNIRLMQSKGVNYTVMHHRICMKNESTDRSWYGLVSFQNTKITQPLKLSNLIVSRISLLDPSHY